MLLSPLLLMRGAVASSVLQRLVVDDRRTLGVDGSPYRVDADLVVTETGVLTVDAGVRLVFAPGRGLTIRGALIAKVNSTASITPW